jgi:peroxisome-assembly ATPase
MYPKAPPKIAQEHTWGVTEWGKKAGPWGQGVDGLKSRAKHDDK